MVDAIGQLALLHKAISGAEMPGHKYKSRKRVKGSWVYDYGDKKVKGAGGASDPMDAAASPVGPVPRYSYVLSAWRPWRGYALRLYKLAGKKGYLLRAVNMRTQEPVDSGTVYKTYAAATRAGHRAAMKPKPAQQPLTAKAVAQAKADVASIEDDGRNAGKPIKPKAKPKAAAVRNRR